MTGPATPQPEPGPGAARSPLRMVLLAVIAVGLVLLGGGAAVALGLGRDEPPGPGSVDAGFAQDMSLHHLQAVEMANLALERSDDPEIRQLAFDISSTQNNQVGRMHGWLSLWDLPVSSGDIMGWMEGAGAHAGHDPDDAEPGVLMPGMASEADLANLRSLSGNAFDVEFLRLMIRHHQGGQEMAEYAAQHADVPAVRRLARSMDETQTAETQTMTRMLTARGGVPLPAP